MHITIQDGDQVRSVHYIDAEHTPHLLHGLLPREHPRPDEQTPAAVDDLFEARALACIAVQKQQQGAEGPAPSPE